MIYETVITTINKNGEVHIAPMGIRSEQAHYIIAPFKPSTTLENLELTRSAVVNMVDDVRIIAGCLSGRRSWPLKKAELIAGYVLEASLSHIEVEVDYIKADELRPGFYCKAVHTVMHRPFSGFNRAQAAVVEAAILVSRLHMLPTEKINSELAYLQIAVDKTAGEKEKEAWEWLMTMVETYRQSQEHKAQS